MNDVIYVLVSLLVIWSVWYLIRHIRKQMMGGGCGCGCESCGRSCPQRRGGGSH